MKKGFAPIAILILLFLVVGLGFAVTRVTDLKNVFQKPRAEGLATNGGDCLTSVFKTTCGFNGKNWCAVGQNNCDTGQVSEPTISVICPANSKLVNTGTYCTYPNGKKSYAGSTQCVPDQECSTPNSNNITMNCQSIVLSPDLPVYKGGENITITIVGSPSSQNIDLYWKSAYLPMSQGDGWNQITGTYDNNSKTFSAQWTIPMSPQEIVLAVNNHGANGWCSGNPCSSSCPQGAYWYSGGPEVCSPSATCCSGCQKKIVVDPLRGLNSINGIDTKDYFKLDTGNYWEYEGINYTYPIGDPMRTFTSRIEVEQPTIMCNHKAVGMRFLKDKASGYWGEKFSYFDPGRWAGALALRSSMFYFYDDSRWNSGFTGSPWFTTYNLLPSQNQFKGLGAINQVTGYETSGSEHFYYAPYLYAPRFLPLDPTTWKFKREDITYDFNPNIDSDACKYETSNQYKNDYNTRGHGWETKYGWEDVQTPVYSGKALRIIFLEYGDPNSGFLLREDWLFAKNMGLIMIRVKDIYQKSKHDTNGTNMISRNNCGSQCSDNTSMVDPMLEMKLAKAYLGSPLIISSANLIQPGGNWLLDFSNNYTGYLDYSMTGTKSNGAPFSASDFWTGVWVEDGKVTVPVAADAMQGTYTYKFRRHLPDLSSGTLVKGEALDTSFTNNLPWSNDLLIQVSSTSNNSRTGSVYSGVR